MSMKLSQQVRMPRFKKYVDFYLRFFILSSWRGALAQCQIYNIDKCGYTDSPNAKSERSCFHAPNNSATRNCSKFARVNLRFYKKKKKLNGHTKLESKI